MWPDRVSNPGPLTYQSGALPTALRGPASFKSNCFYNKNQNVVSVCKVVEKHVLVPNARQ